MTPHQKSFAAWLAEFSRTCRYWRGVPDPAEPLRFTFQTDLGELTASVHESDYDCQKKRGFVDIYLRFKTYSTGKVYDHLHNREFNGFSGKWNIMVSGDSKDIESLREATLNRFVQSLDDVNAGKVRIDSKPNL